jgi:hypothetical protein
MSNDIKKVKYRNGSVSGVWVAEPDKSYNFGSFVNGRLYIFENGKLIQQCTHNGWLDFYPVELAESEATFWEIS